MEEIKVFTTKDDRNTIVNIQYEARFTPIKFNIDYIPEKNLPFFLDMLSMCTKEIMSYGYNKGKQEVQDSIKNALGFIAE